MDQLTDEEKEVIDELRRRTINDVTPKMLEDVSLFYRFAKARDFNLGEAEIMLRKNISWRKEMEVDTILTEYKPPEVMLKYGPIGFLCIDKAGCAVVLHDCGRADMKGLSNSVKKMEFVKYMVYIVERNKEKVIELGDKTRVHLGKPMLAPIYNFEDLTYAKAVNMKILQLLGYIVKSFLDNYPEHLNTITVINAPFYYAWIYAMLKPILPSTVIQKVRIYGADGWKETLLEKIDADDLPAYLGGNKTDPDGNPFCETIVLRGQNVPKRYYMQKGKKTLNLESDVEKLLVMPFSKEEITFAVEKKDSYLEWEFETKNRDIDFSLLFRGEFSEEYEPVVLIPKERIDTSYEPEKGCFKCEKVGNYTIVFDNSYSWFYSKEVYYRAEIKMKNNNEP